MILEDLLIRFISFSKYSLNHLIPFSRFVESVNFPFIASNNFCIEIFARDCSDGCLEFRILDVRNL